MTASQYHRVRIHCAVKCASQLHVGDGQQDLWKETGDHRAGADQRPIRNNGASEWQYNRFARDERDLPTLPPATLRGALRAACADKHLRQRLFGNDPETNETRAGLLRRLSARLDTAKPPTTKTWLHPQRKTTFSRHVQIDPITGAAAHQQLFTFEVLPRGARFELTFELRDEDSAIDDDTIRQFIDLFKIWDGSDGSAIGGKKSRAFGRLELDEKSLTVKAIKHEDLLDWFDQPHNNPVEALEDYYQKLKEFKLPTWNDRSDARLTLTTASPLLINAPEYVTAKPPKKDELADWLLEQSDGNSLPQWFLSKIENADFLEEGEKEILRKWNHNTNKAKIKKDGIRFDKGKDLLEYAWDNLFIPDLEYARDANGDPIIPGSSLAGALRSQARRIVMTIALNKSDTRDEAALDRAKTIADQLCHELFGGETRQSMLIFGNAQWQGEKFDPATMPHCQTFIAIDRFTGGVAEKKLYQARAIAPGQRFTLSLSWRKPPEPWMKGLFILALRDLHEGRQTIGWGAHKGYGLVTITGASLSEALGALPEMEKDDFSGYVEKLDKLIAQQSVQHNQADTDTQHDKASREVPNAAIS